MKKITLLIMVIWSSFLGATIIESNSFAPRFDYLTEDTLVIFDIDGVVMEPIQMLGNDQWAYYEANKFINCGGLPAFFSVWEEVQKRVAVKRVDEHFSEILAELKKRGNKTIGFTARGTSLHERTKVQLASIGIDLSQNCGTATCGNIATVSCCENGFVGEGFLFEHGIIFVDIGKDKGVCLKRFFEMTGKRPSKIIFFDDRMKNVKSLETFCKAEGIDFVGIRYGGADGAIEQFEPMVSDVQLFCLRNFDEVISDDRARSMIHFFDRVLKDGGDFARS
jgi:hypothetical protein